MGPLEVAFIVAIVAIGIFFVYWGVKQIWTWKEPMSTPARFLVAREKPEWEKALENFFSPIFQVIGGIIGVILLIGLGILGLYLFLVLLKFLWARA
jgi:hypothetical protein